MSVTERRDRRVLLPRPDRIPRADLGGAPPPVEPPWYRPPHRQQDPALDPAEPYAGESSDAGYDHGWSNCTMAAGAMALDFHTLGGTAVWGGHLRHAPGQPDQAGGTDLWDVEKAWAHYGEDLEIRSGAGWDALVADRAEGRAILLTGEGDVPGSATFDGGHAIVELPETHSDGRWLQADPLCTGPEWVDPEAVRAWAERLQPSINYARTAAHPPSPPAPEAQDMTYNVAPKTTHRDAVLRPNTIIYADSALLQRSSHSDECAEQAFGFDGSGPAFHVIINGGATAYVSRDDVLRIVTADRTYE